MKLSRSPAVAGSFYPAQAEVLEAQVKALLANRPKKSAKRPQVLVVPHAGYEYSGQVAASAFKEIEGENYERVMLLGPSHHFWFEGAAATLDQVWQSPLGEFQVTRPQPWPLVETAYHKPEHCLQVMLRLLGLLCPQARILPLLLAGGPEQAQTLAVALEPFVEPNTLWVISSDFCHVGPSFGFDPRPQGYKDGPALDKEAIDRIAALDIRGFENLLEQTGATICGALPILVALRLIRHFGLGPLVFKEYDNSARTGGRKNSVGYAAFFA